MQLVSTQLDGIQKYSGYESHHYITPQVTVSFPRTEEVARLKQQGQINIMKSKLFS